jgi:hypothetical protein
VRKIQAQGLVIAFIELAVLDRRLNAQGPDPKAVQPAADAFHRFRELAVHGVVVPVVLGCGAPGYPVDDTVIQRAKDGNAEGECAVFA